MTFTVPDKGFTHAGRFHADDVFAAALLRLCNPNIRIQRGFSVPEGYDGIVFDIGDGPFDHHGKDSPVRECGVKYAAFGLLWRCLLYTSRCCPWAACLMKGFCWPATGWWRT